MNSNVRNCDENDGLMTNIDLVKWDESVWELPVLDNNAKSGWMDHAECSGMPSDLFFDPKMETIAVDVCARCIVSIQCLEFAEITKTDFGIWGGSKMEAHVTN